MEISQKYKFNLPSSADDDIADINDISDNFRIIDNNVLNADEVNKMIEEAGSGIDRFEINEYGELIVYFLNGNIENLGRIVGEMGPSGVYYGTEEPTDASHPVWINPEGIGFDTVPATQDYVDKEVAEAKSYADELVEGINVPIKTSQLINDTNFVTAVDIPYVPTNLSEFANDAGFRKITYGTNAPDDATGDEGDIYIQIIQ